MKQDQKSWCRISDPRDDQRLAAVRAAVTTVGGLLLLKTLTSDLKEDSMFGSWKVLGISLLLFLSALTSSKVLPAQDPGFQRVCRGA